jgi:hypothetical protein
LERERPRAAVDVPIVVVLNFCNCVLSDGTEAGPVISRCFIVKVIGGKQQVIGIVPPVGAAK